MTGNKKSVLMNAGVMFIKYLFIYNTFDEFIDCNVYSLPLLSIKTYKTRIRVNQIYLKLFS